MAIAVAGYLLITLAFIIVYLADETHHLLELIFLICGAVLNIVAGVLCVIDYADSHKDRQINSLILAVTTVACGVIMVFDTIRELKKSRDI